VTEARGQEDLNKAGDELRNAHWIRNLSRKESYGLSRLVRLHGSPGTLQLGGRKPEDRRSCRGDPTWVCGKKTMTGIAGGKESRAETVPCRFR